MTDLPAIYWYLFWVGALLLTVVFGLYVATITHRRNMKALEILATYAERGTEPPPAVTEQLAKQIMEPQGNTSKYQGRAALLRSFIGFLFSACSSGGLHTWLTQSGGPAWAIIAAQTAMAFFGFGAFGLLLATLLAREK